jgi:copper(I)-binding protein
MTFLRTAIVCVLLNLTTHAQPNPTVSDATAAVRDGAVEIYATVSNPSMYDIYLTAAASDAAGKAELIAGGKPASSITVPSYGSVEFKAGGTFVRLSELKGQLKAGDEIKLTISTDGGVAIAIAAVVR